MAAWTLQNLLDQTLSMLDSPQDSTAGLYTNGGATTVISTNQTLTEYLNETAAELARSCIFYPVLGNQSTGSTPPTAGGQQFYPLRNIIDGNGSNPWAAVEVSFAGTPMMRTTYSLLRSQGYLPMTDATGISANWYPVGDAVALYPVPTTAATIQVYGPGIPPILSVSSLSAMITWLPDDEAILMCQRTAMKTAIRNAPEDAILGGKVSMWGQQFIATTNRFANKLMADDPMMFSRYFAGALAQQQMQVQQQMQQGQ